MTMSKIEYFISTSRPLKFMRQTLIKWGHCTAYVMLFQYRKAGNCWFPWYFVSGKVATMNFNGILCNRCGNAPVCMYVCMHVYRHPSALMHQVYLSSYAPKKNEEYGVPVYPIWGAWLLFFPRVVGKCSETFLSKNLSAVNRDFLSHSTCISLSSSPHYVFLRYPYSLRTFENRNDEKELISPNTRRRISFLILLLRKDWSPHFRVLKNKHEEDYEEFELLILMRDSKGFWWWCITHRITGLLDSFHCPVFYK
jgi:hypothetical protein